MQCRTINFVYLLLSACYLFAVHASPFYSYQQGGDEYNEQPPLGRGSGWNRQNEELWPTDPWQSNPWQSGPVIPPPQPAPPSIQWIPYPPPAVNNYYPPPPPHHQYPTVVYVTPTTMTQSSTTTTQAPATTTITAAATTTTQHTSATYPAQHAPYFNYLLSHGSQQSVVVPYPVIWQQPQLQPSATTTVSPVATTTTSSSSSSSQSTPTYSPQSPYIHPYPPHAAAIPEAFLQYPPPMHFGSYGGGGAAPFPRITQYIPFGGQWPGLPPTYWRQGSDAETDDDLATDGGTAAEQAEIAATGTGKGCEGGSVPHGSLRWPADTSTAAAAADSGLARQFEACVDGEWMSVKCKPEVKNNKRFIHCVDDEITSSDGVQTVSAQWTSDNKAVRQTQQQLLPAGAPVGTRPHNTTAAGTSSSIPLSMLLVAGRCKPGQTQPDLAFNKQQSSRAGQVYMECVAISPLGSTGWTRRLCAAGTVYSPVNANCNRPQDAIRHQTASTHLNSQTTQQQQ